MDVEGTPDPATTPDLPEPVDTVSGVRADADLDAHELIEVIAHCNSVIAAATHRMLVASSLVHQILEEDYHARVAESFDGHSDTAEEFAASVVARRSGADPLEQFGPNGFEQATTEIGAVLTRTPAEARELITTGDRARYRLEFTAGTLATGRIDYRRFQIAVKRTQLCSPEVMHTIDVHLAESIVTRPPMSITRFTALIDAIIAEHDGVSMREQRRRAHADRDVTISPDRFRPGQSSLRGKLPTTDAADIKARLDALTRSVHPEDPRTTPQRRHDAFLALARGQAHLTCLCDTCTTDSTTGVDTDIDADPTSAEPTTADRDQSTAAEPATADTAESDQTHQNGEAGETTPGSPPAADPPPPPAPVRPPVQPTFHIVVNLSTLLGLDNQPAFCDGQGIIDADTARELLTEARRHYIDPRLWNAAANHHHDPGDPHSTHDTGDPGDPGGDGHEHAPPDAARWSLADAERAAAKALNYTPSKKLQSLVRAGELCCTFPGCNAPVWLTDLDHTTPFNHHDPHRGGTTTSRNLKPLCRFHHRMKTFSDWRDYQDAYGRAYFLAPTGHMFLGNAFNGRDLFGRPPTPKQPDDHPARRRLETLRTAEVGRQERWDDKHQPPF